MLDLSHQFLPAIIFQLVLDILLCGKAGKPQGCPVVFHGGPWWPGWENLSTFFDPQFYPDCLVDPTWTARVTAHSRWSIVFGILEWVAWQFKRLWDEHSNIEDWYVFGGSLARPWLATYAIHHAERVKKHYCLNFLGAQEDSGGSSSLAQAWFLSEAFALFRIYPQEEQDSSLLSPDDWENQRVCQKSHETLGLGKDLLYSKPEFPTFRCRTSTSWPAHRNIILSNKDVLGRGQLHPSIVPIYSKIFTCQCHVTPIAVRSL